jgi:hypothetical protein
MSVTKKRNAGISLLIALLAFIGIWSSAFVNASETQEWTGWLIDLDCVGANPKTHTQNCNLMTECIASGLGIYAYTADKGQNEGIIIGFTDCTGYDIPCRRICQD